MSLALKILVGADVPADINSGAGGTVLETNAALRVLGHDVEEFWEDTLGKRITHGNLHNLIELPFTYWREVRRRLSARRFDVVQLSQPYAYAAGRHVLSSRPSPLMVWRSHGLEGKVDDAMRAHLPNNAGGLRSALRKMTEARRRWVQRQAIRWADGMVVPCADDREYLINVFGAAPERVKVIWHGVPDRFIDADAGNDPSRWTRLLHVSQMSANKAPMVIKAVAAEILHHVPGVSMTWVCPREHHDQLMSEVDPALRARVSLVDWVARDQLMRLYDTHGIFLFSTLAEGAAKVVMEAMSRGMCVVSSRTSGPLDYISDGLNGRLVPVADTSAMVKAARELLQQPVLMRKMGDAARMVARHFRWSRCAREMVDFYSDLNRLRAEG